MQRAAQALDRAAVRNSRHALKCGADLMGRDLADYHLQCFGE
jgi:hypothetical protein